MNRGRREVEEEGLPRRGCTVNREDRSRKTESRGWDPGGHRRSQKRRMVRLQEVPCPSIQVRAFAKTGGFLRKARQ